MNRNNVRREQVVKIMFGTIDSEQEDCAIGNEWGNPNGCCGDF